MMLVFLLEEASAKAFLENFLPRMLPEDVQFKCIAFEGKQDLEKQIIRKIRHWIVPETKFVILRDQDSGDCRVIKKRLLALCNEANRSDSLVRIACHELESWYLGNLLAVEQALQLSGLSKKQKTSKYREPDKLSNASEELFKLTKNIYQKVSGSREIGKVMPVSENCSTSFNAFVSGVRRVALAS